MTVQIEKAKFDMEIERRKLLRQTWGVVLSAIAIVVAAFAAGHFIR